MNPIQTIPGYYAFDYYDGLTYPTSMCFGPDSTLYVCGLDAVVWALRDVNQDGVVDSTTQFATNHYNPLGMAFDDQGRLYVSSAGKVTRLEDLDNDYVADTIDTIIAGLPVGLHQNSGIAFHPNNGQLYLTIGSSSNAGAQPFMSATISKFHPDGTFIDVVATGLRNPYDLVFVGNDLFAPDNAVSGDTLFTCYEAPDEINKIKAGSDYGFPNCFGVGDCVDVSEFCVPPPCGAGDCERGGGCPGTESPLILLDPHSAPAGICAATNFPGFQPTDVFLALWGQRESPPGCTTDFGHKVVWFSSDDSAITLAFDFAWGFQAPIDVVMGPDSCLYVADFDRGKIYRITKIAQTGVPDGPLHPLKVRAAPNPARHTLTLRWGAPTNIPGNVEIYDIVGRRVAHFDDVTSGFNWDLRSDTGSRVSQGMYWVRIRAGTQEGARKILVLD